MIRLIIFTYLDPYNFRAIYEICNFLFIKRDYIFAGRLSSSVFIGIEKR